MKLKCPFCEKEICLRVTNSRKITENNRYIKEIVEVVEYLNETLGCGTFKIGTEKTKAMIRARFKEGFTVDDFKKVIDLKWDQWGLDSKMRSYLRPLTLFGTKFEGYLNESRTQDINF